MTRWSPRQGYDFDVDDASGLCVRASLDGVVAPDPHPIYRQVLEAWQEYGRVLSAMPAADLDLPEGDV